MSILLQRGHGRILSGFFKVFSWELLLVTSLCSLSVLAIFDLELSSFMEGVFGLTLHDSGKDSRFLEYSVSGGGSPSCSVFSSLTVLGGES